MIDDIKPYRSHLSSDSDLITSVAAACGFSAVLLLEEKRRAAPFAQQASILRFAARGATVPNDLLHIEGIEAALLMASGVPVSERAHLRAEEKVGAIQSYIDKFLIPAGENFVEKLVSRFLSVCDETVNLSMLDAHEVIARRKLSRSVIATLALSGVPYSWLNSLSNTWMPMPDDDSDIELHLCGLSWAKGKKQRTLVFNRTVPFLKNNVDLCLLACGPAELPAAVRDAASYVALGELKGGIDPAGADEHWKTARSALARIRTAFEERELKPHTFFVGAAIAEKMAGEIWSDLESNRLENAANLTAEAQLKSLSGWLCRL